MFVTSLPHRASTFVFNMMGVMQYIVWIFIDRIAGAIIRLVASVCMFVHLSVGAFLFELFDL